MNLNKFFAFLYALFLCIFAACSDGDKTAGGTTEDAGIIANLNVAGLAQKGPFTKGSAVTVQGVNCKTMESTGESFEGVVKSDKGDFGVDDVNLSTTCALFEVTGYYFNELTEKKSSEKMTLKVLTDLENRKNVNINLFTTLECDRVKNLVIEKKMSFAEAKTQAEKEVLAAFNVKTKDGEFAQFEDLNILEKGDGNAALLAVSVMVQSDLNVAKLTERVNDIATDIAKDGSWDDDKTKTEIAEWAASATASGKLDTICKNIEEWDGSDEVSSFETVVEKFVATVIPDIASSSSIVILSSGSREGSSDSSESVGWSWDVPERSHLNPNIDYDSIVDSRDNRVYKVVRISVSEKNYSQVWMAENLKYADSVNTPSLKGSSWCYRDSAKYCEVSGRYYSWAAAIDSVALAADSVKPRNCGYDRSCGFEGSVQGICPKGWHLPTEREWGNLIEALGGSEEGGKNLKTLTGWDKFGSSEDNNGVDAYGFSSLPTGRRNSKSVYNYGSDVYYWCSDEFNAEDARYMNINNIFTKVYLAVGEKFLGQSIRCVKD